jgi:GntR family galactonate operon transcriptional repressor
LPAERHLEIRFGASRSVVRDAVKILVSKGLVTVGTPVRPRSDWSLLDQDVLGSMSSDGLAHEMLLAPGETRQIVEPAAAALAAERATAEDRAHIRQRMTTWLRITKITRWLWVPTSGSIST